MRTLKKSLKVKKGIIPHIFEGIIPFLLYDYCIKYKWMDTVIQQQQTMTLSSYMEIYDLVVLKDNLLRKINELINFSFVYNELMNKYFLIRHQKIQLLNLYLSIKLSCLIKTIRLLP